MPTDTYADEARAADLQRYVIHLAHDVYRRMKEPADYYRCALDDRFYETCVEAVLFTLDPRADRFESAEQARLNWVDRACDRIAFYRLPLNTEKPANAI